MTIELHADNLTDTMTRTPTTFDRLPFKPAQDAENAHNRP